MTFKEKYYYRRDRILDATISTLTGGAIDNHAEQLKDDEPGLGMLLLLAKAKHRPVAEAVERRLMDIVG